MTSRLRVEGLSVTLAGRTLLSEVSFEARRGEMIGMVGDSGSGKSMTALALIGLLPPGSQVQGSLNLDDAEVGWDRLAPLRGRRIGVVFQEPSSALNPLMTISDQVAEGLCLHAPLNRMEAHREAEALLDRVGLPSSAVSSDRYPHELSGGQRQRVALAIALAGRPDILIADEPTTALDVTTQAQILHLLARLTATEGLTTLLISHDLGVIGGVCSRVLVMSHGRLVEQGETTRLLEAPSHPVTRRLMQNYDPPEPVTAGPQGAVLLEAKGLTRRYLPATDGPAALHNVHLSIRAGERVGVIGESGSGKSTLVRSLLGLDPPDSGRVTIAGVAVDPSQRRQTREQLRQVQVVFQDPVSSLNPRQPIGRILAEPLHLLPHRPTKEERQRRVREALASVGLGGISEHARPHEFSGGQRQRLAIARALVIEPKLLVLDEAVSALDAATRNEILLLLQELWRSRGLGFLFVTHDLSVVRSVTDRVIVLRHGEIVDEGPTAMLLTCPEHPYTRELVGATPSLGRRPPLQSGSHDAQ